MTAPCLVRLEAAIAQETNADRQAELLAEKGCYLARVGESESVQAIRAKLRQTHGKGESLGVSIRLMLLEGLDSYFRVLGGQARDRISRAQLLSVAAQDHALSSLASGWLAHIDFNDGRISDAIRNVRFALEKVQEGQWDSMVRIGLVCGDLHMAYSDISIGRRWYAHAHHAAIVYGDQAAIGAWTYNSAAIRLFRLRVRAALGLDNSETDLRFAEAEIGNAVNFQSVAGVRSLDHLLVAAQSHVCMLRHDYVAAASMLNEILSGAQVPDTYAYRATLLADAVLANVEAGNVELAKSYHSAIEQSMIDSLDVDDRIIVIDALSRVGERSPEFLLDSCLLQNLEALRVEYERTCAAYGDLLAGLEDLPTSLDWARSRYKQ